MIRTHQPNGRGEFSADLNSPSDVESSAAGAGDQSRIRPDERASAREPWKPLLGDFQRLGELFAQYSAARADGVRLRIRRIVLLSLAGVMAALLVTTALVTCLVLALLGAAHGLAALAGGRLWVGELGVGAGLLLSTGVLLIVVARAVARRNRQHLREKYEHNHDSSRDDVRTNLARE
ncbi:MAG: hypothetical protein AB7U73_17935 [Pirellulales bacterium]